MNFLKGLLEFSGQYFKLYFNKHLRELATLRLAKQLKLIKMAGQQGKEERVRRGEVGSGAQTEPQIAERGSPRISLGAKPKLAVLLPLSRLAVSVSITMSPLCHFKRPMHCQTRNTPVALIDLLCAENAQMRHYKIN